MTEYEQRLAALSAELADDVEFLRQEVMKEIERFIWPKGNVRIVVHVYENSKMFGVSVNDQLHVIVEGKIAEPYRKQGNPVLRIEITPDSSGKSVETGVSIAKRLAGGFNFDLLVYEIMNCVKDAVEAELYSDDDRMFFQLARQAHEEFTGGRELPLDGIEIRQLTQWNARVNLGEYDIPYKKLPLVLAALKVVGLAIGEG